MWTTALVWTKRIYKKESMMKIHDGELKLMELVWQHEPISAKELSVLAAEVIGWNRHTTYTVATKLVEKGFIHREEPGFECTSAVTREEVQKEETKILVDRLFHGSRKALFSALLENENLSDSEIAELRELIAKR